MMHTYTYRSLEKFIFETKIFHDKFFLMGNSQFASRIPLLKPLHFQTRNLSTLLMEICERNSCVCGYHIYKNLWDKDIARDEVLRDNGPSGSGMLSLRWKYLNKDMLGPTRVHTMLVKIFHCFNYSLLKIFRALNFRRLMSATKIFYRCIFYELR